MDANVVAAGATVGLAVAMPLGPIGLMVVGLGRRGWRSGGAAAAGVATADLTWAAVAVTGGAAVAALPGIAVWQVAARAALVGIGLLLVVRGVRRVRGGVAGAVAEPTAAGPPHRWFAVMYGLTLPNPLTVAVFTAAALGIGVGDDIAARVLFAVSVGATSLVWQVGLAAVGRHVVARTGPVVEGLLTVSSGGVLLAWPLLG